MELTIQRNCRIKSLDILHSNAKSVRIPSSSSQLPRYVGLPVDQVRLHALLFFSWKKQEKECKCVMEELEDLRCIPFVNWSKYIEQRIHTTISTYSSIYRFSFLCLAGCYLFCIFLNHLLPYTCLRIFLCVTKSEHEIRNSTWNRSRNRIQYLRQPRSSGNQIFAKFSKSFTSTNKKNYCKKL